jgi:hypothetical protein
LGCALRGLFNLVDGQLGTALPQRLCFSSQPFGDPPADEG